MVAVATLAALLAGCGGGAQTSVRDGSGAEVTAMLDGIPVHDNVLGDPAAPVRVSEFIDPRCPICADFSASVLPQVLDTQVRSGDVRLARRTWAILGEQSVDAALAFEAAAAQDKLWPYSEVFFANQGPENVAYVDADFLRDVAEEAGLDMARFDEAMDDETALADPLFATDAQAKALGLTGTPAFLVEGPAGERVFTGAVSAEDLAAAVQAVSRE